MDEKEQYIQSANEAAKVCKQSVFSRKIFAQGIYIYSLEPDGSTNTTAI